MLLQDLAVVLGAAVVVVTLLSRLGISPVAGFIVAGVMAGPQALGLVKDAHTVTVMAEAGVVLLLFEIGMELSVERLKRLWKPVLLGGSLQVGLSDGIGIWLATTWGYPLGQSVFLGFLVAVSSTAIVLTGLGARGELEAPHGRLTMGILLFQDLCVLPMMLSLPLLSGDKAGPAEALKVMGKSGALLVGVLVVASVLAPRALAIAARTRHRDLFVLTVMLVIITTAWAASHAGVSLALGAFLAGLVVAGSDYRHQALSDVLPFRELFASIFFVSVGMLLDPAVLVNHADTVAAWLAGLMGVKFLVMLLVGAILRMPARASVMSAVALCQVGEFAFVLAQAGAQEGLLVEELWRDLSAAAVLSMVLTPLLLRAAPHVAAGAVRFGTLTKLLGVKETEEDARQVHCRDHVIIAGYGAGGHALAEALRAGGVPYIIVDMNPDNVRQAKAAGEPALFGDVTSPEVLRHIGIGHALELALLINDPSAAERAAKAAREIRPDLFIAARSRFLADAPGLFNAGATEVVPMETMAALELTDRILRRREVEPGLAQREITRLRDQWEQRLHPS